MTTDRLESKAHSIVVVKNEVNRAEEGDRPSASRDPIRAARARPPLVPAGAGGAGDLPSGADPQLRRR